MAPFITENTGRGVWWVIHMLAKNEISSFRETMEAIGDNFFCEDICKPHIKDYISKNPIPRDRARWYQWTIDFHNAVNARLGKRQLSRSEVDEIFTPQYNEDGSCKSCVRTIQPEQPNYYQRSGRSRPTVAETTIPHQHHYARTQSQPGFLGYHPLTRR